jgi:hypothetical protein
MNKHEPRRWYVGSLFAAIGFGIALTNFAIVRAERVSPDHGTKNLFKCSTGQYCLSAQSTGASTFALYATANNGSSNAAILGSCNLCYGVAGISAASYGVIGYGPTAGIFGEPNGGSSSSAPGVYGRSENAGPGTEGTNLGSSAGVGVYGASASGDGVEGVGLEGIGLYGVGLYGIEGQSYDSGGISLFADAENSSAIPLYAINGANRTYCEIDPEANMTCSGQFYGGALKTRHRNSNGQRVTTFASESASATVEDTGEARMLNGVGNVMIPSDFASVIDRSSDYYVFLTPLGDTRGLYVSMKTSSGFQVRENERGRANVTFDYRIVARPIDATGERLPPAPRVRRPHVPPAPSQPKPPAPPKITL